LISEEPKAERSEDRPGMLLGQPMHERQLGVKLDRKPAIGRCQEKPRAGHPGALADEASLICEAADVLKHGGGMHKVERPVIERQVQTIAEHEPNAGIELLEECCVVDAASRYLVLVR